MAQNSLDSQRDRLQRIAGAATDGSRENRGGARKLIAAADGGEKGAAPDTLSRAGAETNGGVTRVMGACVRCARAPARARVNTLTQVIAGRAIPENGNASRAPAPITPLELKRRAAVIARSQGDLATAAQLEREIRDDYLAELAARAQAARETPLDFGPLDTQTESGEVVPADTACPAAARAAAPPVARAAASSTTPPATRVALTTNPRKLRYWRNATLLAAAALHRANEHTRKSELAKLIVPREVHALLADICDNTDALSGALDYVRRHHGPAIVIDVEAACLFRERGAVQHDDWSCPRARRKAALLVFLLMSPHLLERSSVTGSASTEELLVTAGVPQTLLARMLHSGQRDPYHVRTIQRDLAEIDLCTELLLRWRTPVARAEAWERQGNAHGVVNRYCVRAGMVREQMRRALNAGEALVKRIMLRSASWMLWRPAPARGSHVASTRGGIIPAPA